MKVSVVIVDYEGQRYWKKLLSSLGVQRFADFELVVVDNGNCLDFSNEEFPYPVRLFRQERNLGFAEGANFGARQAKGDWIVFLNNDTEVSADWLQMLINRTNLTTCLGAVVSKVHLIPKFVSLRISCESFIPCESCDSTDKRNLGIRVLFEKDWKVTSQPLHVSGFHGIEWLEGNEWRWTTDEACIWIPLNARNSRCITLTFETPIENTGTEVQISLGTRQMLIEVDGKRHELSIELDETDYFDVINSAGSDLWENGTCLERGIYEKDQGQYDSSTVVSAFSGCSVLINKKAFNTLNGFDPAFFAYYEDTDLSWRMRKAGWKIVYEPKSVVRHHHSGTSQQQSPFFCFHIYRNFRWNVAKNARWSVVLKLLAKECLTSIPKDVLTNTEYSRRRLKLETVCGMLRYMYKRIQLRKN